MPLEFTQGETPTLSLTATSDTNGTAVDITGGTFRTVFLKEDGATELEIGSSAHTILVGASGTFTVDLTATETQQIQTGSEKTFFTEITISGNILIFWARKALTVFSAALRDN